VFGGELPVSLVCMFLWLFYQLEGMCWLSVFRLDGSNMWFSLDFGVASWSFVEFFGHGIFIGDL